MSVDIGRKNRKSINLSSNALELSGNIKDNAQNNFDNLTRSVDHPPVHRSMIKLETKKNNENDKLTNSISNNKDKFFQSNESVHNNSKNITNDDKIFYTQTNSKCKHSAKSTKPQFQYQFLYRSVNKENSNRTLSYFI